MQINSKTKHKLHKQETVKFNVNLHKFYTFLHEIRTKQQIVYYRGKAEINSGSKI